MTKRVLTSLAWIVLFTLLYVAAGKLGLSLASLNRSASPVWPPTGLALAAMLLVGYRVWPAVLVGAFIVNYSATGQVGTSLAICAGNTLEALIGAALAHRFAGGLRAFDRTQDVFRFVFFAAIPSTAACATIGVTSLAVHDPAIWGNYRDIWLTWWTGDFVSDLVVAPLIINWGLLRLSGITLRRALEATLLVILLLAISDLIFGRWSVFDGRAYALAHLGVPLLLWSAFRFHQRGATAAALIMSSLAVWETRNGSGPFAITSPNDSYLLLQAFLGGNTLTMLVLAAVVGERERVIASLGRNEQRLRMALDAGGMGTWDWDILTGAVQWSPGLERIHGLAPGSFNGTFDAFLKDIHPDDRAVVQQRIQLALQQRTDHQIEYRLCLPDGQVRWVEGRGRIIHDRFNCPMRMTGICQDVTAQRLAQLEREDLLKREQATRLEAERANRAKDNFLAVLSHELRTPLTPVMLTASLLENESNLPKHVREEARSIRRNIELEARLIDDLLDVTRISRGKLQLNFQIVDIHEIIRRTIDICTRDRKIALAVELGATQHHVRADGGRIQQVFWNLLSNALKFTPDEGTIGVRSYDDGDESILVEVADSGSGIDPALLPKLFNAFEQGESEQARRAGGLGLGLTICRALVEAHKGRLMAQSDGPGRGATFIVTLPVMAAPVATATDGAIPPGNGMPARSLKILLVDDHPSTLAVMEKLLTSRNHRVVTATSVASALEAAQRESFELVISDLGLPDGMGYDIMKSLQARQPIQGIALSGYGMADDIRQSRAAGFREHLTKPVDLATLEAAISRVLAAESQ